MTSLCRGALAYAANGWPVFPLQDRDKPPYSNRAHGLPENAPGGFHLATTDVEQVAAWWDRWPHANIGLAPGRAGLLVADIDGPAACAIAEGLGLLDIPTLAAETGRTDFPGQHLYFEHPAGRIGQLRLALVNGQLKNVAGTVPGLEIKADAGYVLLPPSIHPSGRRYTWRHDAVQPLPAIAREHIQRLTAPRHLSTNVDIPARTPRYIERAIQLECDTLARTPEGGRNHQLNVSAFSLARFLADGQADAATLIHNLALAASRAGLPEGEITRTIGSAFKARGVTV